MKKLFIGKVTILIATLLLIASAAQATDINTRRYKRPCKGWHKSMLQPKNNWKSYVRYR